MEDTKLIAKKRDLQGSPNSRRMRKAGMLPAVVYGDGEAATPVQIETHAFEQLLHHHSSETLLVDIEIEGEGSSSVLVKEVQHHPVTSELVHVDLLKVSANKPIQVDITIEVVGEAAGVMVGGVLDLIMHTLAVECLPGDLVDSLQVDVSELEIGSALHASDIKIGAKLKLLTDPEAIVVAVAEPRVEVEPEEEEVEEAEEGAEPEVISEKKADDEDSE
jgi:large subunit ribosomal protein L25